MKKICFAYLLLILGSANAFGQYGLSLSYIDHKDGIGSYYKPGYELSGVYHTLDQFQYFALRLEAGLGRYNARYDTIGSYFVQTDPDPLGSGYRLQEGHIYYSDMTTLFVQAEAEFHALPKKAFSPVISAGPNFYISYYDYDALQTDIELTSKNAIQNVGYVLRLGLRYYYDHLYLAFDVGYSTYIGNSEQEFIRTRISAIYDF